MWTGQAVQTLPPSGSLWVTEEETGRKQRTVCSGGTGPSQSRSHMGCLSRQSGPGRAWATSSKAACARGVTKMMLLCQLLPQLSRSSPPCTRIPDSESQRAPKQIPESRKIPVPNENYEGSTGAVAGGLLWAAWPWQCKRECRLGSGKTPWAGRVGH